MPSSMPKLLTPICEEIINLQPITTALDIGVGLGKWGMLIREYSEAYLYLRFTPEEWKCQIDGIEIHDRYINDAHHTYYNNIFIGDANKIIDNLQPYDLIVMIDVIEHIEKGAALKLVDKLRVKAKHLIISYCNTDQGSIMGNEHERHISKWQVGDFRPKKVLARGLLGNNEYAAMLV
jgi:predicted TPR repeat methyltransferase